MAALNSALRGTFEKLKQRAALALNLALRSVSEATKDRYWRTPSLQCVLQEKRGDGGGKQEETAIHECAQRHPYERQ